MAGEEAHETGRDGVRRAKDWLERTGRVEVFWTAYEHRPMLTVLLPSRNDRSRSFDLSGVIRGGDLDARQFFAEIKKYSAVGNQAKEYGDYLAKCYCKLLEDPEKPYEFMWITWHPFSLRKWTTLCDKEEVLCQVSQRQEDWLGLEPVDEALCGILADRLWLIVLSDKQECLVMSDEMLGDLRKAATRGTKP